LIQKLSPQEMERRYAAELAAFRAERQRYLVYGYGGGPGRVGVVVDNVPIFFDSEPYIDANSRTMVPVRAIAEALGAEVGWDGALWRVTLVRGDSVVNLTIGSNVAVVNGVPVTMDTVAVLRNSRTMVPVRFVSEFFGAVVGWDGVTRTVTVSAN